VQLLEWKLNSYRDIALCRECGKSFLARINYLHKEKFCSKKCSKKNWYNLHFKKNKDTKTHKCPYCGIKFKTIGLSHQRFCCATHQKRMWDFNSIRLKPILTYKDKLNNLRNP